MYFEEKKHVDKSYEIPILGSKGHLYTPSKRDNLEFDQQSQILKDLNTVWDVSKFRQEREPLSFGVMNRSLQTSFRFADAPRVMDMPIKFPYSDYKIPNELEGFLPTIKEIADLEETINPQVDDYFCYLTLDTRDVNPNALQRESPCHVDGMQTSRQDPTLVNHSYLVSSSVPTTFYKQPFMVDMLDLDKHNLFWELNRQVAMTNSHYAKTHRPFELLLMDAYTVHRGSEVEGNEPIPRNWLRMSYEVRKFDREGNTHNPMFEYDWKMEPREIKDWNLSAYDPNCDPSLRRYPWEALDGSPNIDGVVTQPNLKPLG